MTHLCATPGRHARAKRTRLLPVALALLALAPSPRLAQARPGPDLATLIPAFNRICSDLARSREELRSGLLDDDHFSERVLALFVDADSIREVVDSVPTAARSAGGPLFAVDRCLRYLIDSLRENYVGIVAKDGIDFVAADRALQAAVAWRTGISAGQSARNVDLEGP
jgi:hypothetical protein